MAKFVLGLIVFTGLVFYGGWIAGSLAHHEPTTEECLSVCIDEYEKMGC